MHSVEFSTDPLPPGPDEDLSPRVNDRRADADYLAKVLQEPLYLFTDQKLRKFSAVCIDGGSVWCMS